MAGLVIEVEDNVVEFIKEGIPLFTEHYKEIAHYQDIPLNPDYDSYMAMYKLGKILIITAKRDEKLVGYVVYIIGYSPHYKESLQACQDILFVLPSSRKSTAGIGYRLLKKSEEVLKNLGVQVINQHVKIQHDFSPLLEKMGYDHVEKIYQKRLQ